MHSKTLLQILKPLAPAINQKPMLPILECVCIRDGKAMATNTGLSIIADCDLPDMCLPYVTLVSILSVLDEEINIKESENDFAVIAGKKKYKLPKPYDIKNFPLMPVIESEYHEVDADFFYAVEQAAKNTNMDDLNSLRGIFIDTDTVYASDNFAMYKQEISTGIKIRVPLLFAQATKGWQSGNISANSNHFQCASESITVDVTLIDGNFPNFAGVFPTEYKSNFSIDRQILQLALKQSQVYEQGIITCKFEPGLLTLLYTNPSNEESTIPINAAHDLTMDIAFNTIIFSRLLSCLPYDCKTIEMQIDSETKPAYILYNNITLLIIPFKK